MDQHEEVEAVEPDASVKQMDPRDERVMNLEAQLAEAKMRERNNVLRIKAKMENLRRHTELNVERVHKSVLEEFINELLPVLDSLDRTLEVADKDNDAVTAMVEGIGLTRESMLDVVAKFGVQAVANIDVPMGPDVHQAVAMVEFDGAAVGNVLMVMQKGYILNEHTIRTAMVFVAKAKG